MQWLVIVVALAMHSDVTEAVTCVVTLPVSGVTTTAARETALSPFFGGKLSHMGDLRWLPGLLFGTASAFHLFFDA
jgi:hypothetical protein